MFVLTHVEDNTMSIGVLYTGLHPMKTSSRVDGKLQQISPYISNHFPLQKCTQSRSGLEHNSSLTSCLWETTTTISHYLSKQTCATKNPHPNRLAQQTNPTTSKKTPTSWPKLNNLKSYPPFKIERNPNIPLSSQSKPEPTKSNTIQTN